MSEIQCLGRCRCEERGACGCIPASRSNLPTLCITCGEAMYVSRAVAWQPIETAPKGSRLLGATPRGVRIIEWDEQRHHIKPRPFWSSEGATRASHDRDNQPTHWQPLPALPEPKEST